MRNNLLGEYTLQRLFSCGKFFDPFSGELQVKVGLVGLIILVSVVPTPHGDGGLYHGALVPLVEAGDADHPGGGRGRRQGRPPGRLVVEPLPPGVSVPRVPRPHPDCGNWFKCSNEEEQDLRDLSD